MAERDLERLIKDYDCSQYDILPKFLKRRVDALKKLQLEHIQIQHQYHQELQELELKYEKLYQPLYEQRFKIINGEHEPTDEECQLPANIVDNDFDGDQENSNSEPIIKFSEDDEKTLKSKFKGIPGFWLGCLVSTYNFNDSIESYDRKVLRYLTDIRLTYAPVNEHLTYKLEFLFEDNPYFTNKVLIKTYYLKSKPDEKDPFSYEGFEVVKSEGCEINWNTGKDVTTKTVTVKQQNKNDGRTREKKKEVERDSFFYFFKPPEVPENPDDDTNVEEISAIMAVDFELGEVIRQSIIPKATLYYTGYMIDEEEDDEDDDEDDDDDDEDDDDDDDSDGLEYDSDSSSSSKSSSSDSLNSSKDKKKLVSSKKSPKNANAKSS